MWCLGLYDGLPIADVLTVLKNFLSTKVFLKIKKIYWQRTIKHTQHDQLEKLQTRTGQHEKFRLMRIKFNKTFKKSCSSAKICESFSYSKKF